MGDSPTRAVQNDGEKRTYLVTTEIESSFEETFDVSSWDEAVEKAFSVGSGVSVMGGEEITSLSVHGVEPPFVVDGKYVKEVTTPVEARDVDEAIDLARHELVGEYDVAKFMITPIEVAIFDE